MIKHLSFLKYYFRRGKARREHIHLNEKLKDLTTTQALQKQIDQHRHMFETKMPQQTLSQTLKQQNPKLQRRFKVDRAQLQKNIKKEIYKQLKIERIIPAAQGQEFQTLQSRSHIYDQRAEIQFEQKFRTELFKKKETNRLIQKVKNDYHNYLEEPKNVGFAEYQENLKRFKNSKIDSMMNFKRNNEQLRLLIDSGYIDNPDNLGVILDKMNLTPRLEHQSQQNFNHSHQQNFSQKANPNLGPTTSDEQNQLTHPQNTENNKISPQIQSMHETMLQNIDGPSQLRNPQLLQQFFDTLEESNSVERQKAREDLQLMKQIKEFQLKTFESRYDTLNFRFKGEVDFTWMKESELLSYIKTQKNINTQPQGLLTMYTQNLTKQTKFNQPVITPTVMSRIYSVCSLYKFPQTDENNKINMLNDKKYVDLERNLFKNIHQLSDTSFADAVFAYCRNHKDEQGLLRLKMSEKIVETMWKELNERVNSIEEEDLGLVLRSVIHTSMLKNQSLDWTHIVESLGDRLPLLEKDYEFQTVISFLTLVPVSSSSLEIVQDNIRKYKDYQWQSKETLESYLQCSSFLIRYKDTFSPMKSNKMIQELKHLFCSKYQEIMPITEQLSINVMPQLLSVMYFFEHSKQPEAKFQIQVPNKLVNKCKKQIVDNIRMQKELISKQTVGNVAMSMAMIDYCKSLSTQALSIDSIRQTQLPVLQMSVSKSLFPFRALPFNSINYFTYHEMLKLINSEIPNLSVKVIAQTLFAASLVRYKNEGIFQEIVSKCVQKIYYDIKKSGEPQSVAHLSYTKEYILFVCSFHHSRMVNKYFYHFADMLMQNGPTALVKIEPNLLIRFFESIASLSFTTDPRYEEDYKITEYFSKAFDLCYEENLKGCLNLLKNEELLVVEYLVGLFGYFRAKQLTGKERLNLEVYENRAKQISAFMKKFSKKLTIEDRYLRSVSKLLKDMIHHVSKAKQIQSQNQIQLQLSLSKFPTPQFILAESEFYRYSISSIMDQQQQIGSQFKYQTIYENVRRKLVKESSDNNEMKIDPKTWRIELPNQKQVYFLTTYQHLFAKYHQDNTSVRLFGLWKVYAELYALKNWKFKFICTFLEG